MTQMAELVERPLEVILTIFPMFKKLKNEYVKWKQYGRYILRGPI